MVNMVNCWIQVLGQNILFLTLGYENVERLPKLISVCCILVTDKGELAVKLPVVSQPFIFFNADPLCIAM